MKCGIGKYGRCNVREKYGTGLPEDVIYSPPLRTFFVISGDVFISIDLNGCYCSSCVIFISLFQPDLPVLTFLHDRLYWSLKTILPWFSPS